MNRDEYTAQVERMNDSALEAEQASVNQQLGFYQRAEAGSAKYPNYQQYAQKGAEIHQDKLGIIQAEWSER